MGLVCFDVEGMKPEEVVARLLARRVVASVSPYGNPCARLAPSPLNTPEEADAALREVRALATRRVTPPADGKIKLEGGSGPEGPPRRRAPPRSRD